MCAGGKLSEQVQSMKTRARQLYHRAVPDQIRFPIGHTRRTLIDQWIRFAGGHGPLPPRQVLKKVQITPWVMEYLEVGARGADTIRNELTAAGLQKGDESLRVLDFGCGLGRTLRHLRTTGWDLSGCDVDSDSVAWTRKALPGLPLEANGDRPPLPYAAESFDAIYAISVFTHFDPAFQHLWAKELARILRPGGLALITTMGPWAFHPPPAGSGSAEIEGFWFFPVVGAFNNSAAVHTEKGLQHFFSSCFEPVVWKKQGLDGFQDLSVFRLRASNRPGET